MCLIFFALNHHPNYDLILVANRDEFYSRPTASADYWTNRPDILAGRDLLDQTGNLPGTWLGMTKDGRMSMLTNYRDLRMLKSSAPSRGQLVTNYLAGNASAFDYLSEVQKNAQDYNGFNLIAGTVSKLYYYSNTSNGIQSLSPGIYGISNHLLETPWPKVTQGKEAFRKIVDQHNAIDPEQLVDFMKDGRRYEASQLPDTGVGLEREKMLSSIYITSEDYGTRCTTVILAKKNGEVLFLEKTFVPEAGLAQFSFNIGANGKKDL